MRGFIPWGEYRTPSLKGLLLLKTAAVPVVAVQATATGNPATFETGLVRPLVSCEAAFVPVQSGSGTPAPDNVRPISGWTGLTVYHSGDISKPDTYPLSWQTEAGTVYGGTLDATTGLLTVKRVSETFTWGTGYTQEVVRTKTTLRVFSLAHMHNATMEAQTSMCDMARWEKSYAGDYVHFYTYQFASTNSSSVFLILPNSMDNNTQVQVVYELAEPITYHLTTQSIQTLHGINTVWSDANGNLTIKYLKKG